MAAASGRIEIADALDRDLLKAFPMVQFVATTHSPFIIQSLPDLEDVRLVNLDDERAADFVDKSVEDIAEIIQGIAGVQRSQRHREMGIRRAIGARRADILRREQGAELRVYVCEHGHGWHLTKGYNKRR